MNYQPLLSKFFAGKCTQKELIELHKLLQEDNEGMLKQEMREIWDDLTIFPVLDDNSSNRILKNILKEIQPAPKRFRNLLDMKKIAAIISLMAVALSVIWFSYGYNPEIEVTTRYGEIRKVILPDGSLVYLNSNSTLQYDKNILDQEIREVKLNGEAYFKVNEIKTFEPVSREVDKKKFIVHSNNLDIEVIGTQFNVKNRRGSTEIVLDEGEVHIHSEEGDQNYKMKPGDKLIFDQLQNLKVSRIEEPELYSLWKNNELYFDQKTLAEIAQEFQDNFGLEVQIIGESLKQKKFTGFCPSDNPEILLETLKKSFNLTINKNENRYVLQNE